MRKVRRKVKEKGNRLSLSKTSLNCEKGCSAFFFKLSYPKKIPT